MSILTWFIGRGREASTWAGFSGIALAAGMSTTEWSAVGSALAAIFGAVAVLTKEPGTP